LIIFIKKRRGSREGSNQGAVIQYKLDIDKKSAIRHRGSTVFIGGLFGRINPFAGRNASVDMTSHWLVSLVKDVILPASIPNEGVVDMCEIGITA